MNIRKRICLLLIVVTISTLIGGLAFAKGNEGWANEAFSAMKANPNRNVYNIIVFGGDPEGVAAAVSAARAGAKVLLLSYEDDLGGLMTYGWLNSIDMNHSADGTLVTQGIFKEFYELVGGDSFDVGHAKQVFHQMVSNEANITYIPSVMLENVIMQGNTIKGLKIFTRGNSYIFYANRIIDATQDGDIAAIAGAPYTYGQQDIGFVDEKMCVTLIFKVKDVDWDVLKQDIANRKAAGMTGEGINASSAWGYGDTAKKYVPINENTKLRGLNIGKQNDGTVLINALQLVHINGLDGSQKNLAILKGKDEAKNVVNFLRQNISAFANAQLVAVAPELYIRETRHFQGEYILKARDVLENKDFWDKIAIGAYPMDIQTTAMDNSGYVIGNPDKYSIPLRCLIPQSIENLFIVGKSASYSSLAASSARVIPVGMCTGEAAGVASVYSIINNVTPRSLTKNANMIVDVQNLLRAQGAYLDSYNVPVVNANSYAYEDMLKLTSLRLILHGYSRAGVKYSNNLTNHSFINLTYGYLKRIKPDVYRIENHDLMRQYMNSELLTSDALARIAIYLVSGEDVGLQNAFEEAKARNLLPSKFVERVHSGENIVLEDAYVMAVKIIETLMGEEIVY